GCLASVTPSGGTGRHLRQLRELRSFADHQRLRQGRLARRRIADGLLAAGRWTTPGALAVLHPGPTETARSGCSRSAAPYGLNPEGVRMARAAPRSSA